MAKLGMRFRLLITHALILPVLVATGCAELSPPKEEQLKQGLIWMFPGVEGGPISLVAARRGFRDAGVESGIRVHEWGRPLGAIANLVAYEENRQVAGEIAGDIVTYRNQHKDAPIDLVGYSGGGGMAIMVAESLPRDVRLRNVILCQAAISPGYDLTQALRRVEGKIINFHSPVDLLLLGAGTTVFGTMDRKHGSSAGKDGFDVPLKVREKDLVAHFEQRCWSPEMLMQGHYGAHFGMFAYGWNKQYVAPYLRQ